MNLYKPGPETLSITPVSTDDPLRLALERVTNGQRSISTDHANIHAGISYSFPTKFTIAAAGIAYLEFQTPVKGYVHFKPMNFSADGPKILVQLYEAPTLTPGSVQVVQNRRRLGTPPTASSVVRINPTGVSGGTLLDQDYIGGGVGIGGILSSGGNASNDNEWVLAQNTLYLLKLTNNGSSSADVNMKLFWYEEDAG